MKALFPIALFAALAPVVAFAQTQASYVTLTSETFVARTVTDANGNKRNELQAPSKVLPGDPLVFLVKWNNATGKPATDFVINNPIPKNTVFTGARDPQPLMSVDGGKTFGPLATLKVRGSDGKMRPATNEDVTGLRWKFSQPIPAGNTGSVAFFAVVK